MHVDIDTIITLYLMFGLSPGTVGAHLFSKQVIFHLVMQESISTTSHAYCV